MKRPKANCPSCNSLQLFAPKTRVVDAHTPEGMKQIHETYIRCLMCRWESVVSRIEQSAVRSRDSHARRSNAIARGWR